jgi:hypothetical protein
MPDSHGSNCQHNSPPQELQREEHVILVARLAEAPASVKALIEHPANKGRRRVPVSALVGNVVLHAALRIDLELDLFDGSTETGII